MGYSLDLNRPTPYIVIDNFDAWGREGVYAGTYEEDVYDYISHKNVTHIFVNIISSKTGNLYRTLFNKCSVI